MTRSVSRATPTMISSEGPPKNAIPPDKTGFLGWLRSFGMQLGDLGSCPAGSS